MLRATKILQPLCSTLLLLGACGIFESFEERDGYVSLLGTHHRTPVDGEIPPGSSNKRTFVNDEGWEITLARAYTTTTAIQFVRCDGTESEEEERAGRSWVEDGSAPSIDFRYGPTAENFIDTADSRVIEFGDNRKIRAGRYCTINVEFSPYPEDSSDHPDGWHPLPADEEVLGATVFVRGVARKGDDEVSFNYRFVGEVIASIDTSLTHGGSPLKVDATSQLQAVTISKLYDRYFDSVDFASSTYEKDLKKSIAIALEDYTFATEGSSPKPPWTGDADDDDDDDDDSSDESGDDDDDDDDDSSDEDSSEEESSEE
jgi:hypothetical protein